MRGKIIIFPLMNRSILEPFIKSSRASLKSESVIRLDRIFNLKSVDLVWMVKVFISPYSVSVCFFFYYSFL